MMQPRRSSRSSVNLILGDYTSEQGKNQNYDDNMSGAMTKGVVVVVCLLAMVEGMDIVVLGASGQAFFLDIDNWTLATAGWLSMGQGVTQNMGAVFWGVVADRGYMQRRTILCVAAFAQGLCTFLLAFISTIPPMWPVRLANGFFLAALRPLSNGVVADLATAKEQGYYFGLMQGFFSFGMTVTGMTVGPVAETKFDLPVFGQTGGWRIAFVAISSIAFVASVFSAMIMPSIPPPFMTEEEKRQNVGTVLKAEIGAMIKFVKTYPSFNLMILQGIFGSIPWNVLGQLNTYVRLSGFPLSALFWLGLPGVFGVAGGFLGGLVSDQLTAKIGPRGRPLTAMITVAFGVPLQYFVWYGIAPGSEYQTLWVLFGLLVLFNLLANWAQPGCNFPVLSQIVTGKERNKVMCWEMAFENTMATVIGSNAVPAVVALLGAKGIEYKGVTDLGVAQTLGTAVALCVCVPWIICFFVYSTLLWAFPYDLARKEREEAEMGAELGAELASEPQQSYIPG